MCFSVLVQFIWKLETTGRTIKFSSQLADKLANFNLKVQQVVANMSELKYFIRTFADKMNTDTVKYISAYQVYLHTVFAVWYLYGLVRPKIEAKNFVLHVHLLMYESIAFFPTYKQIPHYQTDTKQINS